MKRLYATVVENEARFLGKEPEADPTADLSAGRPTSTLEAIEAAERKLGFALSKTWKQFANQVGAAVWPVQLLSLEAIAADPVPTDRPKFLVAFADDGSGNEWCFDTRAAVKGEYPILFWDHEDPPQVSELETPEAVTSFDEWLKGMIATKLADDESEALKARRARIEAALLPHRETNTWPYAPGDEEIIRCEATIGFALPKDYVWFTTNLGSTKWPLEIVDAVEMGRLTDEMKKAFPNVRGSSFAFGREADGTFVAFQKGSKLVSVGGRPLEDKTFFDFLERRIEQRSKPKSVVPAPAKGKGKGKGKGAAPAPAETSDDQIPWRIVEDDRTNSVWRAVAEAKQFTATTGEDGRIQVAIEDFLGGKRRMFIEQDAWAVVKRHLDERTK